MWGNALDLQYMCYRGIEHKNNCILVVDDVADPDVDAYEGQVCGSCVRVQAQLLKRAAARNMHQLDGGPSCCVCFLRTLSPKLYNLQFDAAWCSAIRSRCQLQLLDLSLRISSLVGQVLRMETVSLPHHRQSQR